jgi:hypothetical protein
MARPCRSLPESARRHSWTALSERCSRRARRVGEQSAHAVRTIAEHHPQTGAGQSSEHLDMGRGLTKPWSILPPLPYTRTPWVPRRPHSHPIQVYFLLKTNHLHPRPPFHPLTPRYNDLVRANLPRSSLALSAFRRPAVFAPEKRSRPLRHCSLKSEYTPTGELRLLTRAVAPRPRPQSVNLMGRTQEMMKTIDLHAGFFLGETHGNPTGTNRKPGKNPANPSPTPASSAPRSRAHP